VDGLLEQCATWAGEVGSEITAGAAPAVVVGPGASAPAAADVATVHRGQGVDGYRWAIRSLAARAAWPFETVAYGSHPDQVADVRRPGDSGHRDVAVLLHGGFWTPTWGRGLMDGIAVDLARRGWITWNVEYRRTGAGGGWPATGEDVLAALDHLTQREEVPGSGVLIGHSAGAQLALWAASRRGVDRVVSLAGICDLVEALRTGVGGSTVSRFLDGADPGEASPFDLLPMGVPALLATTTGDPLVPAAHSRRYRDAAVDAGDDVELLEVPGDDHFAFLRPDAAWPAVAARLKKNTQS
jgi:acetyl esterase/lipase